jgi:osmotically-inducible protein OsmY
VNALRANGALPPDRITVSVEHGWATLSGTLEEYDQSAAAERTVRDLPGVKGVSNAVVLQAPGAPAVPPHGADDPA